ncbi:MAG: radical SAM protein [Formivibrio sp.]|nr:radical SAM protein [Formivibrio sp.]
MSENVTSKPLHHRLRVDDHDRDSAGLTYVYPVISRRAGGVSVGINLNPNNACNWQCVYCQVPDLKRGPAPQIDLVQLEDELRWMLGQIMHGDFMRTRVPEDVRRLNDVAFSGNGEPTTSKQFEECVALVGRVLADFELVGQIKLVLITNGSQLDRPDVQSALDLMSRLNGEVWFKFDRAPDGHFNAVNQVVLSPVQVARRLRTSADLCSTWLQTCMFAQDGQLPDATAIQAWLDFVKARLNEGVLLQGVLLYGLARQPMLPGASEHLSAAPAEWMEALKTQIQDLGLPVKLSV